MAVDEDWRRLREIFSGCGKCFEFLQCFDTAAGVARTVSGLWRNSATHLQSSLPEQVEEVNQGTQASRGSPRKQPLKQTWWKTKHIRSNITYMCWFRGSPRKQPLKQTWWKTKHVRSNITYMCWLCIGRHSKMQSDTTRANVAYLLRACH